MKTTVYYDGSCPICRREISFYKAREGAERIHWFDVSKRQPEHLPAGLTKQEALTRFHVLRADGRLVTGGDAFRTIWTELPALRMLGALFSLPGLRSLLKKAYDGFLWLRFRWNNG
jgi:predicted DCC family thiol-disulfide oxidoreductase YuxK